MEGIKSTFIVETTFQKDDVKMGVLPQHIAVGLMRDDHPCPNSGFVHRIHAIPGIFFIIGITKNMEMLLKKGMKDIPSSG